jgi:hypothetical protein
MKWYNITRLDGSSPRPREMPKYMGNTPAEAFARAGLAINEGRFTEITCPECCYELEYGEVGPYSVHTCEME